MSSDDALRPGDATGRPAAGDEVGQLVEVLSQRLFVGGDRHASDGDADGPVDHTPYFRAIARARLVLRRVFRLVDEQAKRSGLDPLEHQALIQAFGSKELLRINGLAARLDIGNGLASRIVSGLVEKGLVERVAVPDDRRITLVRVTDAGRDLLVRIDERVQRRVAELQAEFSPLDRAAALTIFGFYVGAPPTPDDLRRLDDQFGD